MRERTGTAVRAPSGSGYVDRSVSEVDEAFSDQLERWLESDEPKTLGTMGDVFAEKSFAVTILLLMFVPALPLPTGGITHVFEVITVLLAAQMVLGRRTIWLPKRWQRRELGATLTGKAIPFIVRRVRWFERFSHPRAAALFNQRWFLRFLGLELMAFAIAAAGIAPPFSGLDTLPALGAVVGLTRDHPRRRCGARRRQRDRRRWHRAHRHDRRRARPPRERPHLIARISTPSGAQVPA